MLTVVVKTCHSASWDKARVLPLLSSGGHVSAVEVGNWLVLACKVA